MLFKEGYVHCQFMNIIEERHYIPVSIQKAKKSLSSLTNHISIQHFLPKEQYFVQTRSLQKTETA